MIKRREMILGIPAGFGALLGTNLLSGITQAAEKPAIKTVGGPKRIIFFLQNHGFDPLNCIPKGLAASLDEGRGESPDPSAGGNLKQDQGLEPGWRYRVNNRYGLNLEFTKLGSIYFHPSGNQSGSRFAYNHCKASQS